MAKTIVTKKPQNDHAGEMEDLPIDDIFGEVDNDWRDNVVKSTALEHKQLGPAVYIFMGRRPDAMSYEIGRAIIGPSGIVNWTGDSMRVRDMLIGRKWSLLNDAVFDEGNPQHWMRLPELLQGQRLWAVEER
jgi:hypothetical protein